MVELVDPRDRRYTPPPCDGAGFDLAHLHPCPNHTHPLGEADDGDGNGEQVESMMDDYTRHRRHCHTDRDIGDADRAAADTHADHHIHHADDAAAHVDRILSVKLHVIKMTTTMMQQPGDVAVCVHASGVSGDEIDDGMAAAAVVAAWMTMQPLLDFLVNNQSPSSTVWRDHNPPSRRLEPSLSPIERVDRPTLSMNLNETSNASLRRNPRPRWHETSTSRVRISCRRSFRHNYID